MNLDELNEKQLDDVNKGKLCPECRSINVICTGATPDGININSAFDCKDCECKWEGY